jgi:TPR repeat protein
LEFFRLAVAQGHAIAQVNLGKMYFDGQGVKQNYNEAFELFWLAATQANTTAQKNIGLMYANGQGVQRDYFVPTYGLV